MPSENDTPIPDSITIKARQERVVRMMKNARGELQTARNQLRDAAEQQFPNDFLRSEMQRQAEALVRTMEKQIQDLEDQLSIIRVPTEEELRYRQQLLETFAVKCARKADVLKEICFHGANLLDSKSIIASGEISASQERGLDRSSLDVKGQISITDAKSVQLSLRDYTGAKDFLLPMGCLFVVRRSSTDEGAGTSYSIQSLKLKIKGQISSRFVRVVTSQESLPLVRKLLIENGYSPDLAVEYNEFVDSI